MKRSLIVGTLLLSLAGCGPHWVYQTVLNNCVSAQPTDEELAACKAKAAERAHNDEQALNNLHTVFIAPLAPVEWWDRAPRPTPWNQP